MIFEKLANYGRKEISFIKSKNNKSYDNLVWEFINFAGRDIEGNVKVQNDRRRYLLRADRSLLRANDEPFPFLFLLLFLGG